MKEEQSVPKTLKTDFFFFVKAQLVRLIEILKVLFFLNWVRFRISFLDTNHDESFLLSVSTSLILIN